VRIPTSTEHQPRPLPIRPRPMTGESIASYLRRLARANHLRPDHLRRYVQGQPGKQEPIRPEWLAALAGRPLSALEHALAELRSHDAPGQFRHPQPLRPHRRQADKPELFAVIRQDAHDKGLSIRALADRHGVHRRTVREALASPLPKPRKKLPPRRSGLDPFKAATDAMLRSDLDAPGNQRHTAKRIFDQLVAEHEMQGVSYTTVSDYVRRHRPPRPAETATSGRTP